MSGGWYHVKKQFAGIELSYKANGNSAVKQLYYNDQRHFGTLKFIEPQTAQQELRWKLQTLGPDMLSDTTLDFDKFRGIMRKATVAKKIVSNAIVEQSIISGVGNYLRSEALYQAGINPHRLVSSLSDAELDGLFRAIRQKIRDSYRTGGASIQHYSDINNTPGTFEFEMAVYGKKKDPDGNPVLAEKIGKDTQTTYWVAEKQT
jgi:DNA-formamidopyrimidine glycosylase